MENMSGDPDEAELDPLDQAVVQALMIDARAPFRRIAEVLEVSDQTVIRRYRRMRTTGVLRVVGLPLGHRVGLLESWLRIQCAPDAAQGVANGLARRPDIAWVTLASGGTEIHCVTKARTRRDRDALLLRKLPGTGRVTGITDHTILRTFIGGPSHWGGLDVLTPAQVEALRGPWPYAPGERVELDEPALAVLGVLAREGRASHADLAAATGLSESAARHRLARLRETGAVYFHVEIDPVLLGFHTNATVLAVVRPGELAATGAALADHTEVPFAAAITGTASLLATVVCRDTNGLYTYLTERLGALPAVERVEVVPSLRTVKRAGMLMSGHRLVDPPAAAAV
jgi:DNA-binding Lrp family transcriptional regulator